MADLIPPTARLARPKFKQDGSIEYVSLQLCDCGVGRRGPSGGVCGRCGGAIPRWADARERKETKT